ncbi:MAG: PHP domain-containing protein, partial [Nocardioidaceae bacterium]
MHLDVRSFFSLKDGAFSPEDLARRAAGLGMPAVALTDRDGLYGTARFVAACREAGVKPLLGATLTVSDPWSAAGVGAERSGSRSAARTRFRASELRGATRGPRSRSVDTAATNVILLAQDDQGYANLCRLITDAHMTGERGEPSLASEQICAHAQGLLCLLGPSSLPGSLAVDGRFDAARNAIGPFREAFGERLFVAVQHLLEPNSTAEVRLLLRLAEWIGAKAVATNPVRYLVPGDAFLADALECMREIVPVASHHVSRVNAEGFLKPAGEMRALFAERPDVCDRTIE